MGPLLFLAVAGLALLGCSSAIPPKSETDSAPPAPPEPDCPEPGSSSYAAAARPAHCPSPRGSLSYFSGPSGQEVASLTARIRRAEPTLGFNPQERTQLQGLASTLFEAAKGSGGFFKREYQELFVKALRQVEAGKLTVAFSKPELPPGEYYDPALDRLHLSPVLATPIGPQTKIRWLGALYDLARDAEGQPIARVAHAFERCTMQALFLLESSGHQLDKMSEEELATWLEGNSHSLEEGPLLASALTAFYHGSRGDYEKRFAALRIFGEQYEERLIRDRFQRSYAQAAKDSPFHASWEKITAENYRPQNLPLPKIRADIKKLEINRKAELQKLGKEVQSLRELEAQENKKNDLILRDPTARELGAQAEVRKRFDALIATWAKLDFLRDLEKGTQYQMKLTVDIVQAEEEASKDLAKHSILGLEKVGFNGLR